MLQKDEIMAATLLLSCCNDRVMLPNGELLTAQYSLGKGTLKLSHLPDRTPVIAWFDRNGHEHYRFVLKENGDYFVSPAAVYRSYSEDELVECARQAAIERARAAAARKHDRFLVSRGKRAFNDVATRRHVIRMSLGRQFFDEESDFKFWYTDGTIDSTPFLDRTDIVISEATWAYCVAPTGYIEVVVLWLEATEGFFRHLGGYLEELTVQNTQ